MIVNGPYAGKTLAEYIEAEGRDVLGTHCRRFRDFPILAKFIDAKQNLSIQVHPDNRYALKNEGQYGKTEIQQNSNVTYRVYDYGRVGKDGKKRDLHIEKALAVTNRVPIVKSAKSYPHVADCDYFTVDKLNLDGRMMEKMEGEVSEESFISILMLEGEGMLTCGDENISFHKGDSLFLAAGSGAYQIEGRCDVLIISIREKADSAQMGGEPAVRGDDL